MMGKESERERYLATLCADSQFLGRVRSVVEMIKTAEIQLI
jgi:hypothetical protein